MNGVLIIDKPPGLTSHDVVNRIRRILGERSVGHLGTLDPMATGVLPLVIGNLTRMAKQWVRRRRFRFRWPRLRSWRKAFVGPSNRCLRHFPPRRSAVCLLTN